MYPRLHLKLVCNVSTSFCLIFFKDCLDLSRTTLYSKLRESITNTRVTEQREVERRVREIKIQYEETRWTSTAFQAKRCMRFNLVGCRWLKTRSPQCSCEDPIRMVALDPQVVRPLGCVFENLRLVREEGHFLRLPTCPLFMPILNFQNTSNPNIFLSRYRGALT